MKMLGVNFVIILIIGVVACKHLTVNLTCNDLHILYDESKNLVNLKRIYDNLLRKNHFVLSENEIEYEFFKTKPVDFNISELYLTSEILTQTATLFYDRAKLSSYDSDEVRYLFQNYSYCFINPKAILYNYTLNHSKYRSIDGIGNNLKYPMQGSSYSSFARLLKPQYDDKVHSVRKSVRGYNLPSVRNIVRKLFLDDKNNLNKFSKLKKIPNVGALMFGQYVAHDVGSKQPVQYIDGGDEGIRCCSEKNHIHLPSSLTHSACLPITISKSDPFYFKEDVKCMGFTRSNIISNNPYRIEIGEQVNTVTSFLDHSNIYGSLYETMRKVRSFESGKLKINKKNVLPEDEAGNYFSGDIRVEQSPFLALWHSIFTRNHNLLVEKLAKINCQWGDERLFEEARRINIAIYQKILYEDWLPIFLGKDYCKKYGLNCDCNSLYCNHHSFDINASTMNEFSASAFRYMHSFINSDFEFYDEDHNLTNTMNFSDTIKNTKILEQYYDEAIRGFLIQPINLLGYSSEVLNKLFKNKHGIGVDLLSVDIQRERDHGVPAYLKFRKLCRMKLAVQTFADLFPQIPKNIIKILKSTYKSVNDIDLLVGGALETIYRNVSSTADDAGFFGPTFKCIIGEQFYRFKMGDSYFYTNSKSPYKFSTDQLLQIKNYTVSNLLCDNTNILRIQKNAFLKPNENDNQMVDCNQLTQFNLKLWREVL